MRLRRTLLACVAALPLAVAAVSAPAPAVAADALTPEQKAAVKALVREALLEDPEIVADAIRELRARAEAAENAQQAEAVKAHKSALFADSADPVLGNPAGDVTLVEFFDYRCGYCKSAFPGLMDAVKADGKVRFVTKEFPILGPDSVVAARYALAAQKQGRYSDLHIALMQHKGAYSDESIRALAVKAGLDADRLARDAKDPAIDKAIEKNKALAQALGIGGTPAFVIGDQLIPGAVDKDTLAAAIATARKGG